MAEAMNARPMQAFKKVRLTMVLGIEWYHGR